MLCSSGSKQTRLKRTLFNEPRQYNIQMFDTTIFLKYKIRQIKATEYLSKLQQQFYLPVFVSVALICLAVYMRKIVLSNICIVYCLVSLNSVLF